MRAAAGDRPPRDPARAPAPSRPIPGFRRRARPSAPAPLALTVVDGLLGPARACSGRRTCSSPWDAGTRWTACTPVRLAVIGAGFVEALRPWPARRRPLAGARARSAHRHRRRARRDRMLALLWRIAGRWGWPDADGVALPRGAGLPACCRRWATSPRHDVADGRCQGSCAVRHGGVPRGWSVAGCCGPRAGQTSRERATSCASARAAARRRARGPAQRLPGAVRGARRRAAARSRRGRGRLTISRPRAAPRLDLVQRRRPRARGEPDRPGRSPRSATCPLHARYATTSALSPVESMKSTSVKSTQTSAAGGGRSSRLKRRPRPWPCRPRRSRPGRREAVVGQLDLELTVLHPALAVSIRLRSR